MKNISINLFRIDELADQAKEFAVENNREINTYFGWWDSDYEHFVTLCKVMGIDINPRKIYFKGFYSQGDGSCFESTIEILDLINGIKKQSWKEYAPNLTIANCTVPQRILRLIEQQLIEVDIWTETSHRYYFLHYHFRDTINGTSERAYPHIEEELLKLDKWAKRTLEILNQYLYKTLESTYEYLMSDTAITDTFQADDYLFTEDGRKANRLLDLAN